MYVHQVLAKYQFTLEEDAAFPGTAATDGCELSSGCWDINLGPIRAQSRLTTESSLYPFVCLFLNHLCLKFS